MATTQSINLGKVVPQKGVDYWTDEDKEEIIDAVLPAVTTADNGKVLKVVNGVWVAASVSGDSSGGGSSVPSAEGVEF